MDNPYQSFECPSCRNRPIETVVKVPSIRGYLLGYQITTKRLPTCAPCARSALLSEAGKSLLLGWFSPTALLVNPFLILWNAGRYPFTGKNYDAIRKLFDEAGIPQPGRQVDVLKVLYGLAAAMITADGRVEPEEIETGLRVGGRISADFNPRDFHETVENHANLPEVENYAAVLSTVLDPNQKKLVLSYLIAIAFADSDLDRSEERLLHRIANTLEADKDWIAAEVAEAKAKAEAAARASDAIAAAAPKESPA